MMKNGDCVFGLLCTPDEAVTTLASRLATAHCQERSRLYFEAQVLAANQQRFSRSDVVDMMFCSLRIGFAPPSE